MTIVKRLIRIASDEALLRVVVFAASLAAPLSAFASQVWCQVGTYNGDGPYLMLMVNIDSSEPNSQRCSGACTVKFQDGSSESFNMRGESSSGVRNHPVQWIKFNKQPASTSGGGICSPQ